MVTPNVYIHGDGYMGADVLFGLSTDTKPTNVGNGSFFIAIDKVGSDENFLYCFDAENETWHPEETPADEGGGEDAET